VYPHVGVETLGRRSAIIPEKRGEPLLSDLVRSAQAGDADSFAEVVRRTQRAVYATAYQAALDRDAALDITQETYLYAYEHLRSLRRPEAFGAWVVRICRNMGYTWQRRREHTSVPLQESHGVVPDPAEEVLDREAARDALRALPEDNRHALALWVVDGYTYQEVAELTGVPLSTVKGRIQRARRQLSREVFGMFEATVGDEAPGEELTERALLDIIERGFNALGAKRLDEAVRLADEAIGAAERPTVSREQAAGYRSRAWGLRAWATQLTDRSEWHRASEERLAAAEESGVPLNIAGALWDLVEWDPDLPHDRRDAMTARAIGLFREAGQNELAAPMLLQQGGRLFGEGDIAGAEAPFAGAREVLESLPDTRYQGMLPALDDFVDLLGGSLHRTACEVWQVGCTQWRVLSHGEVVMDGCAGGFQRQRRGTPRPGTSGFDLACVISRLPSRQEDALLEKRRVTRTGWEEGVHETESRISGDPVVTPAGTYAGCLHVVHSIRRGRSSPPEVHECWYAPGVGPVAYRGSEGDWPPEHCVLSRVEVQGQRHLWVPLAVGTVWEYIEAEPHDAVAVRSRARVVRHDPDGRVLIALSSVGVARE
jgi:RNA polymerase sigma-70 factor (ECF subfamily)